MTMDNTLKIGLVGFGKIARDQHLPAIAALDSAELVAVASRNGIADGCRSYPDLVAMLAAEPSLDAISLCQPPQARFGAARTAIQAGKHVFLEKPPGATVSEVEALADLATAHSVTLFASWHSRYAAGVTVARTWLADKRISSIRIDWKEDVRHWHPGQEWIWQAGGFGVFDPGINALSILTALLPERVRLIDAELSIPANRQAPIAASLTMATTAGTPISAEFDFRRTGRQSWDISVDTTEGALVLSNGGNGLSINGKAQPLAAEEEYPAMYRRFVDLILAGQSDVDVAPLQLVADAFLRGESSTTEAFDY